MKLDDPQQKSKFYLSAQNNLIRLGDVFFSVKKLEQKHIKPVVNLHKFYIFDYVEKSVPQLFRRLVKAQYQDERMNNIENPYKYFRLESVFEYHFWIVQKTQQEKFILKISEFRINLKYKAHPTFSENGFWQIKFPHLKHLSLSDSQIFSIEGLSYCVLPVLQKLELHNNKITNLSILGKLSFKNLKLITTYQNPLRSLDKFKLLHAPSIQFLDIDEEIQRIVDGVWQLKGNTFQNEIGIVQKIDFILKSQCLILMKEFRLGFHDRILPNWYQKIMKNISKEIKYFTETYRTRDINHNFAFRNRRRIPGVIDPPDHEFRDQPLGQDMLIEHLLQRQRRPNNLDDIENELFE